MNQELAQPIPRTTLADTVYQRLLELIVTGQFGSGKDLTTVEVAELFSVSRTPVQEALRRLARDGLVEWQTGREPRVSSFARQDFVEIYEMRTVLESAAALRAATRMTDAQLLELRRRANALAASEAQADWGERALEFDIYLHDRIAAASGNLRLHGDITRYRNLVRAFCRFTGEKEDNLRNAFTEHLRILEALEARDGERARATMAKHVAARLDVVVRLLYPGARAGA